MLKLENINFSYNKDQHVLHDFNLNVNEGEIISIQGKSGCGKSTILRLIAGLEKQDTGSIILDGKKMNDIPTNKRNVGFVFQSLALFPHLTVRKNIEYGLFKLPRKERKILVEDIASKVEVSELLDRYPHEISGGQRQRVSIARSLVTKPKILLLDEPFTALDEDLKDSVRKDVKRIINAFGITTILVTHDSRDAAAFNAKTILL